MYPKIAIGKSIQQSSIDGKTAILDMYIPTFNGYRL